jgi:protein-S-isoprenylcysteine O-methyltransferase Ste14
VLSREYFTGALLVIFGGLLRCSAFRALGPLFTFHLTIKNKHTLVTSGPYAWVRHPGYAGMIIWSLGSSIMLLSRGSLVAGTGFMNTILGRGAVYGVVTILAGINWAFAGRLAAEDAVLQKQFGTEWEEWVKRVPYRLVPWIY